MGSLLASVILVEGKSRETRFGNLSAALSAPDTSVKLFGKPEVAGKRRMGVGLARGDTVDEARAKANGVSSKVAVTL